MALTGPPTTAVEPNPSTVARSVDDRGRQATDVAASRGALGAYVDAESDEVVIVVPKGRRGSITAADIVGIPGKVVVQERNLDRGTIDAILGRLEAMRGEIPEYAYAFGFDPVSGSILIQSEAPRSAFSAIERDFPGVVDYTRGEFHRAHRSNDTSPYKGGGTIWVNGVKRCTAGFTMRWASGTRRMITAGHCMTDGTVSSMGQVIRSASTYPYYDIEQISGSSYGGYIYDEDSGWATVMSAGKPTIGGTYCTTGDTTGIYCNWMLRSLGVTICYTERYEPRGVCTLLEWV